MTLRAGTSGFSYKEWKGPFYPEKLPAKEMLSFYAERLPAVEINNTFYRMPKTSVLEGWAEQVPSEFRFVIKASRRITHFKRLKEAGEETGYLLQTTAVLGERLGALLFQLPPNLPADMERLDRFVDLLPDGTSAAFEFRHPSWLEEGADERLRERGLAVVLADTEEAPAEAFPGAGRLLYLRLRRPNYDDAALLAWADKVADAGAEEAYVFFKHEDAGAGPRMAAAFLEQGAAAETRRRPRAVRVRRRREEGSSG